MCKRITAFLLSALLLLGLAGRASAAQQEQTESQPQPLQVTITNLDTFLTFAENCRLDSYSRNLKVSLETDLDLSGRGFTGIPSFSGSFYGNGHTIKGLALRQEGSVQGFFRYLTMEAQVEDLHIIGTVMPGGSRNEVGGIAGSNAGRIAGCTFTGRVSGSEYVGGIAGTNAITGIVENCVMNGSVYGSHFVGGIAGESKGVIRNCENTAKINDTASENTVELSEITLNSLTSSEAANTVTDIGGIAGSSMGVIRDCVNRGNVGYPHMGYNIGGIVGAQSGLIHSCENHGQIQGRKEVGGIAGQMEPTAMISYEEDALQILKRQLNSMAGVVGQTVANIQNTGDDILGQVGNLQTQVTNAQDAVKSLIPDPENPQLPDWDSIQAARNTISTSISGMTESLQGMAATTYSSMGSLSNNLHSLQGQINAMRTTLGNVSETLGGSLTDVSDGDTEDLFMGKVTLCTNYGSVQADRNAGGITGAIAMENDLDPEEDWTIVGENSLNFESELRAVILECTNKADVICGKQNAGGIVGWQSMGLVKSCLNTGKLDTAGAEYVGGISGQSKGFIRLSSAKCQLSGTNNVGGIAGSASIVTDCCALIQCQATGEKVGAILGQAEKPSRELEKPVSGNYYYGVSQDLGAVDGISYDTVAQPLNLPEFLALEHLPEDFRMVTIRFLYNDGKSRNFRLPLGEDLNVTQIPKIPSVEGKKAYWDGLDEADLVKLLFDRTYEARYLEKDTVIQSDLNRGKRPVLLLQGIFSENASVQLQQENRDFPVEEGEQLLEIWQLSITGTEILTGGRFALPDTADPEQVRLMVQGMDDAWRETAFRTDGSYLVFDMQAGDRGIVLIQTASINWIPIVVAALLLLSGGVVLYRKKRKK